jgi:hypothetical protein
MLCVTNLRKYICIWKHNGDVSSQSIEKSVRIIIIIIIYII